MPPAVYAVHHTVNESEERFRFPVPQRVVSIPLVDEGDVTEGFEDHREEQIDEYEKDSGYEESDFEKHSEFVRHVCLTIRQSCSCICASRHVTIRGNNCFKIIKNPKTVQIDTYSSEIAGKIPKKPHSKATRAVV